MNATRLKSFKLPVKKDELLEILHTWDVNVPIGFHHMELEDAENAVGVALERVASDYWVPVVEGNQTNIRRKDIYVDIILRYCSDPNNDMPNRSFIATKLCHFKQVSTLYHVFTPEELYFVENESLRLRRMRYATQLSKVDMAMFRKAIDGDTAAAKLVYDRFEGAVQQNLNVSHSGEIALKGIMERLETASTATAIPKEITEIPIEAVND